MTSFVEAGLGNALVALVLAVVALVVGLVCRRPAVAHALWLLVLIKLVTPPLMSVSLPWPDDVPEVREEPQFTVTLEEVPSEVAEEPPLAWEEELPAMEAEKPPAMEAVEPVEDPSPLESPVPGPTWQTVFGLVWLIGSSTWFAIAGRRLWRFGRLLRHARPAPEELTARVAALSRTLGLRKPPRLLLVQGHLSPMVWAFGRVTLLVPAKLVSKMSATALDTLLAHELAHIRRRDHWVRWLELVGLGLYWWNPVVWLARRELRQAEELCCDAWVVRCLPDARRVYATALVDALDFLSRPDEPVPALGCGLGRVDDLKWRLTMILRGQTSPRLGWTTTLGVFGLAVLLLPLVPGLGKAQKRVDTTPPAKPALDQLDSESRARLEADIRALIEKRVAEATANGKPAVPASRGEPNREAKSQQEKTIQELRAEIAAKLAALKQLEANSGEKPRSKKYDLRGQVKPDAASTTILVVEAQGVKEDPDAVKEIVQKIERAFEGHGVRVSVRVVKSDFTTAPPKVADRVIDAPGGRKILITPDRKIVVKPDAPAVPKPPQPGSDGRIDALEKKLDAVLRQLEALRESKSAPKRGTFRDAAPEDPSPRKSNPPVPGMRNPTPATNPVPATGTPR